jgi:hypothetical protein
MKRSECSHCQCCRLIAGVVRDAFVCRACGRCFDAPRPMGETAAKRSTTQMTIDPPRYPRPSGLLYTWNRSERL